MKLRRLYYLTDTLDSTIAIARDLEKLRIGYNQIHVLGHNEGELVRHNVHCGSPLENYDSIRLGEQGAIVGFLIGLVFIIIVKAVQPFGMDISFWILIPLWIIFTLHGAWSGGLIGTHRRYYRIARFRDDLEQGRYLVLIDVTRDQEAEVKEVMRRYHAEAGFKGDSPVTSNPFDLRTS